MKRRVNFFSLSSPPKFANVLLYCLLLAISFLVLFQVITDLQVFHSPGIGIANQIHFSHRILSRNADIDTINSHKLVNISSWKPSIYYSQQCSPSMTNRSWLPDILLGHCSLKPFSDVLHRLCESF